MIIALKHQHLRQFRSAEKRLSPFLICASIFVMPVVEVDGKPVGTGKPGPVATRLREIYLDEMRKAAI